MVVNYHNNFIKDSKRLTVQQKKKLIERLELFGQDEFNPTLNNHSLNGKYLGHRSINVTGDLRAVFKKINNSVLFVSIDSHSNLYG
ncbi:MAG: type II toxin-antitoxin system mRNA interferase toxin, RelE/StbE family [Candidatus Daviesbacteria bacterium]|nr:type II toxin-antitoxin system mRNA interferase toxin, RelE/StbE family [Candidatus Daviesbacteria bacterium]